MIDKIIRYSIEHKLIVGIVVAALIGWGAWSLSQLPIDAVPDITNNQVQVLTVSPNLAASEVEAFVTFPVEQAMQNLPGIEEIRSISRFGLSVVTVVFEDNMGTYLPRQLVGEQLSRISAEIPKHMGQPEMAPISTGLGEILQYVIHPIKGYEDKYDPMQLRTIQDWIVKRRLSGTKGVIEVNSFGGYLKEYEVSVDPDRLNSLGLTLKDVFDAVEAGNQNIGGAYIEKGPNALFIKGEGMVESLRDIRKIVIEKREGIPVTVGEAAEVKFGHAPRFGAMTRNAKGEVVGGIVMMLKGENSAQVIERVKARVAEIQKSLPEGLVIEPYLDRSRLVDKTVKTVSKNLIEGGLIVIFVLVLLLGNFRAGLVVASVIPLAMLFAFSMMRLFGVSANLMSLGAIDFGLIVDGAVIIVEAIVHRLQTVSPGARLSRSEMNNQVFAASTRIRKSAAFGEIIILVVYLPILALSGIEGKMFKPMAQTVSFAILGALILSLTYVPMMASLVLSTKVKVRKTIADRILAAVQKVYQPLLNGALKIRGIVVGVAVLIFALSVFQFSRMGGEFIPTLEEGDLALHQILPAGSSLNESIKISKKLQEMLLSNFPEIREIVTKIGTAEIPTDPMSMETGDIMVIMKEKDEWTSAKTREELFEKMEAVMSKLPGIEYEFTQPIQMRFNELMTGVRQDIAVKIYGEDLDMLAAKAKETERLVKNIEGVGDIFVERLTGLPQINVDYDREKLIEYGLRISDLNFILETAFAGQKAGVVLEGERHFNVVVRLDTAHQNGLEDVRNLLVPVPGGGAIPIKEVAQVDIIEAPMQVSRENAKRRVTIGINARNRDTESLVAEIRQTLDTKLNLPTGYFVEYGGQFENLEAAKKRLALAVPIALLLIFVLLYFSFGSVKQAILIYTAIPMSAIGGIWALYLRGMPFSISAGVGFIALFGVSVLNGIVLIAYFNQLEKEGMTNLRERIKKGTQVRLRPVLMTAAVASLGFLPMALSNSAGAEVQKPLATVVIGGLVTSTLLTLLVLPILYSYFDSTKLKGNKVAATVILILLSFLPFMGKAQSEYPEYKTTPLHEVLEQTIATFPEAKAAQAEVEKARAGKFQIFTMEPTDFSLTVGQMNTEVNDLYFSVNQGFSFPTQYARNKGVYEKKLAEAGYKRDWDLLRLKFEVAQAYVETIWQKERSKIIHERFLLVDSVSKVMRQRLDAGDISTLEWALSDYAYRDAYADYEQCLVDYRLACMILGTFTGQMLNCGEEASLELFSRRINHLGSDGQVMPHTLWMQAQSETLQEEARAAQAGKLPALNLGYFYQTLDGTPGFQGGTIGFSIPLFASKSRADQAVKEAEYNHAVHLKDAVAYRLRMRLYQLYDQAELMQKVIGIRKTLANTDNLQKILKRSWEAGEVDVELYFRYLEKELTYDLKELDVWYTFIQIRLEQAFIRGNL